MIQVRASLQRILDGHAPCPAVLVDGSWNLLADNAAVGLLTDLVDPALLEPPVNIIRLALHPRGLAPHVVDPEDYAAHLVSRVRRQAERSATTGLRVLLAEAVGYCQELGLDPAAQPRDRIVLPLRVRHPDGDLAFRSSVSVLGAPLDVTLDEVAIESSSPPTTPRRPTCGRGSSEFVSSARRRTCTASRSASSCAVGAGAGSSPRTSSARSGWGTPG